MKTHETTHQSMQNQPQTQIPQTERLSALIDGELSDAAALQAIKQVGYSEEERVRHAEYIAIGDAMRGLTTQPSGFTRRVMAALEDEPVLLAPMPKHTEHRPALWLAAAAAAAIAWGLWQSNPREEIIAPLASVQHASPESAAAMPYLAAHQDFAQAVISAPEMRFSKAALEIRQ